MARAGRLAYSLLPMGDLLPDDSPSGLGRSGFLPTSCLGIIASLRMGEELFSLVTTVAGNWLPRPHPASDAKLSRRQTVLSTSLCLAIPLANRRTPVHGISAKRVAPTCNHRS